MSRLVTLGVIVTRARQRAGRENDDSFGSNECKGLVSELYAELHAALKPFRYYETEATITATGAASYAIPAAHGETAAIYRVLDAAGALTPLRPLPEQHRPRYAGRTGEATRYALIGETIVLYPTPASGTYKHVYTPQPTDLSSSSDSTNVDLVCIDGEKFVLWGVASLMRHKGDSDQQRSVMERDKALEGVQFWASQRYALDNRERVSADDGQCDPGDYPRRYY